MVFELKALNISLLICMLPGMNIIKNYPGAKNGSGVYQNIINLIPPHDIYIDAFLGTAAILRKKKLAKYSICLDRNQICIDVGRQLNLSGCIFI